MPNGDIRLSITEYSKILERLDHLKSDIGDISYESITSSAASMILRGIDEIKEMLTTATPEDI